MIHNKIPGEHSVLKKVKDNFFPSQQKAVTVEKSETTRAPCSELRRDSSPKKWPHAYSSGNFPTNEKRLHSGLNINSSQPSVVSHDLVPSVNSVCSSTNILFKSRRTFVEQSKNKSPQLSSNSQRNVTSQDVDYKDNKHSYNYLSVTKKPNAWRRFSDVVASSFGRDREDLRKDSLQNAHKDSKPTAFSSCFSGSQDAKLYANDSTIGIKAWQQIHSDVENSTDGDKVALIDFDCTTAELDYKPKAIQQEMEIQQSCEDGKPKNADEVSRMSQISPSVLSGKVVNVSRRSKKSQKNLGKRNRHRNRRKSNKATSPTVTNTSTTEVSAEDEKQISEYKSQQADQKTEKEDPIQLAILRHFHGDTEERDSSQTEEDFLPDNIANKMEEFLSAGNFNEVLDKMTEDIQFAVRSYIIKNGGLWLRVMELQEQIKEQDEVIALLQTEADRMEAKAWERLKKASQAAKENSGYSIIDDGKHANDQVTPRISKSGLPEKHVQFSQNLSQDEDGSKPLPLPDIVEYMESSTEDPCDELEEDDLWRVEFPNNDVRVKTAQMLWKRPKMRRHSSVEVGSETPMHLLHFVSGGERVQHLLPPQPEETNRMTARRYSESQTKTQVGEANPQSFAARVRKVFQKIKANAEVKVSTKADSKDTTNVLNLGRSSKRLSDGGVNIGGRLQNTWEEKPRRYSDTLLRSTNPCSDYAATSGENGTAVLNARRISSEGNLGRTGFRTLPTISEDDFIKKLISTSVDSTLEEGCQDLLSNNEAQVSCVVELPPEVVFQNTKSETTEKSPCRQKR